MTKSHEQEWKERAHESGVVEMDAGRGTCIIVYAPQAERTAAGRLIAAAPELARALAGPNGKGHHHWNERADAYSCHRCAHFEPHHSEGCDFGDALRKAGVL